MYGVAQKFNMQKFCFNKLHDTDVKQYEVKIWKRFAALGTLDENTDVIMAWGKCDSIISSKAK
jgi:hypothetical protein